jgi:glycosyltransferase involved in cell wall biosynthesis
MKNKSPVSVIIPCFNCSKTIERSITSIINQTIHPIEIILVDDASSDYTREIIQHIQGRFNTNWIKLILLDHNVGVASARNAGWDQAHGEFIAFLDADDAWHPRKIELQYRYMASAPDVVISGHGYVQVDELQQLGEIDEAVFREVSLPYVFLKNPFVTPSFMVRRNLNCRFLAGRRHMEDHYLLMQVSSAGFGIAKTRAALAFIYKPIYGKSGLSADLLQMQRSELENYTLMGFTGRISTLVVILLKIYSWLKFFRRYMIVFIRYKFLSKNI